MRIPVPTRRTVRVFGVVAVLTFVALVVFLIVALVRVSGNDAEQDRAIEAGIERSQANAADAQANREAAESNADAAQRLARQVRRLGGNPVVDPGDVVEPTPRPPGPRGATGAQGPAPTQGQIDQAVASYCSDTGACRGEPGAAASVTPAQVAAAVTTYCGPRGECSGPRGAPGDDSEVPGPQGEPGQDSTVPGPQGPQGPPGADSTLPGPQGPQGPGPTEAQVAQAVADFCGRPAQPCRGPAGPPGADSTVPGPAGPPGPQCPDGFTGSQATVVTDTGPRQAFVCFAG